MNIKFRSHKREDISFRIIWLNNPRVNEFIGSNPGQKTTKKKQIEWFSKYEKEKKKNTKQFFAICDGVKPIGLIGLSKIDKISKNCDLFIVIGDDGYIGKGISKLAMQYLIDYGFKKLKLHKINLGVFAENKIAVNLYKKMGFKIEGIMKDESFFNGKYHDFYSMALFNKKK